MICSLDPPSDDSFTAGESTDSVSYFHFRLPPSTISDFMINSLFGGEFMKNEDGSMTYNGGNAEAVNVNGETPFDDLKLKLAEMFNLEYKSVSVKYFFPRNNRTLITLASDKDLKMLGYHTGLITANIYVTGKEGFDLVALNKNEKSCTGIDAAETLNKDVHKGDNTEGLQLVETANCVKMCYTLKCY